MGRRPHSPGYRDRWHREREAAKRQGSAGTGWTGWTGKILLTPAVPAAVVVIAPVF
jgi:hypothetical protein